MGRKVVPIIMAVATGETGRIPVSTTRFTRVLAAACTAAALVLTAPCVGAAWADDDVPGQDSTAQGQGGPAQGQPGDSGTADETGGANGSGDSGAPADPTASEGGGNSDDPNGANGPDGSGDVTGTDSPDSPDGPDGSGDGESQGAPGFDRAATADVDHGRLRLRLTEGTGCGSGYSGSAEVTGIAKVPNPAFPSWQSTTRLYVGDDYQAGANIGVAPGKYCVRSIAPSAFAGEGKVEAVTVGPSVTQIADGAFRGAKALTSIFLESATNLQRIGDGAFQESGLTAVTIPASLTEIGADAFRDAPVAHVEWDPKAARLGSIGSSAFEGTALTGTIVVPQSVTTVGARALAAPLLRALTLAGTSLSPAAAATAFDGTIFYPQSSPGAADGRLIPYDPANPYIYEAFGWPLVDGRRVPGAEPVELPLDKGARAINIDLAKRFEYSDFEIDAVVAGAGIRNPGGASIGSFLAWDLNTPSMPLEVVSPTGAVASWTANVTYPDAAAVRESSQPRRYETTCQLAQSALDAGVVKAGAPAFLATGEDYPDAVVASGAASQKGGVLLLTTPNAMPDCVVDVLTRLRPSALYVVGGSGVVSDAVFKHAQALTPGAHHERLWGTDRIVTSLAVFNQLTAKLPPEQIPEDIFFVSARSYADAISASSAAAMTRAPVLLVENNAGGLRPNVFADLRRAKENAQAKGAGLGHPHVVGGTGALDSAIERQLAFNETGKARWRRVDRYFGDDRYETALAVARKFGGLTTAVTAAERPTDAFLATGESFADGVSTAPYAKAFNRPLLLSPGKCLPASTLFAFRQSIDTVHLVGGDGALSDDVLALRPCG